jgi:GDPmannose 4,6-dehydratase
MAFSRVGLNYKDYVVIDPKFLRPAEVDYLLGDPVKAREKMGWKPDVDIQGLVNMMVDADLARVQRSLR